MPTSKPRLRPLDVEADLTLEVDGEPVRIVGSGRSLVVDAPTRRSARRLLQSGPLADDRAARLADVNGALREAGVGADVRVQGRTVARLGVGARPGTVSRLLRLGDVEVRPTAAASRGWWAAAAAAVLGGGALAAYLLRRR